MRVHWGFHIVFWLFIFLYTFDYLFDLFGLRYGLLYSGFELALFGGLFYINLFWLLPRFWDRKQWLPYGTLLLLTLAASYFTYRITGMDQELLPLEIERSVLSFLLNHSLFVVISYYVWYASKFYREREMRILAEQKRIESEMQLLKSQISPHFLFNNLNNLYALVLEKSEDAPEMLTSISDLLRYTIYKGSEPLVPISEEVSAIESFVALQRLRGVCGRIEVDVPNDQPSTENLMLPPLLLLSFVENMFKHGDVDDNADAFVEIKIEIDGQRIRSHFRNSFIDQEINAGIGHENVKQQLALAFPDAYDLVVSATDGTYDLKVEFDGRK